MSESTEYSIAADNAIDRAMGHVGITSGGRGVRKYQLQLTRRQRQRLAAANAADVAAEANASQQTKLKVAETLRAMHAGELDWI
jgi:hypothetical protein